MSSLSGQALALQGQEDLALHRLSILEPPLVQVYFVRLGFKLIYVVTNRYNGKEDKGRPRIIYTK